MTPKAEDLAKETPAGDGRTDKDKLADIGLSEEELAALGDKDDGTEADTGEPGKDADEPPGEGEEDTDAAKGEVPPDKEDPDAEDAKPAPKAKVPDHFTPIAETLSPEDLEGINTELGELKTQFDDGDIDYEKYTDERLKLEKVVWHHEQAEITNENAVEQRWTWEREWYLQSNPELEISQVIYGAFAAQVNALLADEAFATAPGFDLLTEAHTRVAAEIESMTGPGGAPPAGIPPAGDKKAADTRAKDALKKAKDAESTKRGPKTLAGIPAADTNTDVNKFAHLDSLNGEALQKAIDKLSPADLKEYEDYHD